MYGKLYKIIGGGKRRNTMAQDFVQAYLRTGCPLCTSCKYQLPHCWSLFWTSMHEEPTGCLKNFQLQICKKKVALAWYFWTQLFLTSSICIGQLTRKMHDTYPVRLTSSYMKKNQTGFVMETLTRKHVWNAVVFLATTQEHIVLYYNWQLADPLDMSTKHYLIFSKSVIATVKLSSDYSQKPWSISALIIVEGQALLCLDTGRLKILLLDMIAAIDRYDLLMGGLCMP